MTHGEHKKERTAQRVIKTRIGERHCNSRLLPYKRGNSLADVGRKGLVGLVSHTIAGRSQKWKIRCSY
jgi:hypothetical protein